MPANTTEYDLGLLASAQIQSGHLLDGRDHPNTPRGDNPEAARAYSNTGPTMAILTSPVKAPPFYRTKRGIVTITMAFVVTVAIVVGVGVGVSQGVRSDPAVAPLASQPKGVDTTSATPVQTLISVPPTNTFTSGLMTPTTYSTFTSMSSTLGNSAPVVATSIFS